MAKIIKKETPKKVVAKKTTKTVIEKPVEVAIAVKKAKYINKNIQISPRKLRLLATTMKSLSPVEALDRMKFTNTKAARVLVQALKNIIADAKTNFNLNTDTLKFDTVKVDEGMKIKRMDKSHGSRFNRGIIQKRHSRLEIIVSGLNKN
jgi:large subunit ribosomal protein L22